MGITSLNHMLAELTYRFSVRRLNRKWKKAIHREDTKVALELASEIIALDETKALGWRLKAAVYVRICPGSPPDPECEAKALHFFEEAFSRDPVDEGIASGYVAFAHWVHRDDIARNVISRYQGKKREPPFHLESYLNGISTRGRSRARNAATGASIEEEAS